MTEVKAYPVGVPGQAWGDNERKEWRDRVVIKRSYQDEVVTKLATLPDSFVVETIGALSYDTQRYPLFVVKSRHWDSSKPTVLITGGVHGYETSGVQGALLFLQTKAAAYTEKFNIVVSPCVSPWGYETIQRWNPNAVDPNRSFGPNRTPHPNGECEEAAALMKYLDTLSGEIVMHIDLHETTDTDESEFRPAKAARDGVTFVADSIPDGFYLVGDSENPQPEWQRAIIQVTTYVML
jgi:hypothetical protein